MFHGGTSESHITAMLSEGVLTAQQEAEYTRALTLLRGVKDLVHKGYSVGVFDDKLGMNAITQERAEYLTQFPFMYQVQSYLRGEDCGISRISEENIMNAVRHAMGVVSRTTRIIVNHYYENKPIVFDKFRIKKNKLYLPDDELDVGKAMAALSLASTYGFTISSSLYRSLGKFAQHFVVDDKQSGAVAHSFASLFLGKSVSLATDTMVNSGLLYAYFPDAREGFTYSNDGKRKRKLPHEKTVVRQALDGIIQLERLRDHDEKDTDIFMRELKRLYRDLGDCSSDIFLALLFHDIGVSTSTKYERHPQKSKEKFRRFAYANGLQEVGIDVDRVGKLIECHNLSLQFSYA